MAFAVRQVYPPAVPYTLLIDHGLLLQNSDGFLNRRYLLVPSDAYLVAKDASCVLTLVREVLLLSDTFSTRRNDSWLCGPPSGMARQ